MEIPGEFEPQDEVEIEAQFDEWIADMAAQEMAAPGSDDSSVSTSVYSTSTDASAGEDGGAEGDGEERQLEEGEQNEYLIQNLPKLGVYTWGQDQLASWADPDCVEPRQRATLAGKKIVCVAAGGYHSLVVTETGDLYAFGRNSYGQCTGWTGAFHPRLVTGFPVGTHIVAADGGLSYSAALDSDGNVWTWGRNHVGQLGIGSKGTQRTPNRVRGALEGCRVVHISCGSSHMGALTDDGHLYMWGWGTHGRLGLGHEKTMKRPTRVCGSLAAEVVRTFACGGAHTICVSEGNRLYAWGYNATRQCGIAYRRDQRHTSPRFIILRDSDDDVVELACGDYHCMARTSTGAVYVWGSNMYHQLGSRDNTRSGGWAGSATHVPFLRANNATQIAAGGCNSAIVQSGGKLMMYGEWSRGQRGKRPGREGSLIREFGAELPVNMVALGQAFTIATTLFPKVPMTTCSFTSAISQLYSNNEDDSYLDVTIHAKDRGIVRGHKVILASASNYFRARLVPSLPPLTDPRTDVWEATLGSVSDTEVDDADVVLDLEQGGGGGGGAMDKGDDDGNHWWNIGDDSRALDPSVPQDKAKPGPDAPCGPADKGKAKGKEKASDSTPPAGATIVDMPSNISAPSQSQELPTELGTLRNHDVYIDTLSHNAVTALVRYLYTGRLECSDNQDLVDLLVHAHEHGPHSLLRVCGRECIIRRGALNREKKTVVDNGRVPPVIAKLQVIMAWRQLSRNPNTLTREDVEAAMVSLDDSSESSRDDAAADSQGAEHEADTSETAPLPPTSNSPLEDPCVEDIISKPGALFDTGPTVDACGSDEDHTEHTLDLASAFNSELFSDVAFQIEGRFLLASRSILGARCPKFRAMFASGMKEALDKSIPIPYSTFDVFATMIQWIYTDHATRIKPEHAPDVLVLADEYGIDDLRLRCERIISRCLDANNVMSLLSLADRHHAPFLRGECMLYLFGVYKTIPREQLEAELAPHLLTEVTAKLGTIQSAQGSACSIL